MSNYGKKGQFNVSDYGFQAKNSGDNRNYGLIMEMKSDPFEEVCENWYPGFP